jgi:putative membrane protein
VLLSRLRLRAAGVKSIQQECNMSTQFMTKLIMGAGLAGALVVSSASLAQDKADQKFLKDAMEGNLAEVKMGELAQKNGTSDGVRSFGQMLQQDHSAANDKAESVAQSVGMTPPTEPNRKQKADYDKLSKLSGDKFDREFVNHMVMDHKRDIREYERAAKKKNAPAGNYADETLPTLRKHLDTAQSLMGNVGSGKR